MLASILHEKNEPALAALGKYYLKNPGNGFCADYSVLATLLVKEGFRPALVQKLLSAKSNRMRLVKLMLRLRSRVVLDVRERGDLSFADDDMVGADQDNLPTLEAWATAITHGGPLDSRAIFALAEQLGIVVQIAQQVVHDGEIYTLKDAHDWNAPLGEPFILWTGGCHFELVVPKVSFMGVVNRNRT